MECTIVRGGAVALRVGPIVGIIVSLITSSEALGRSPFGYSIWLIAGTLSTLGSTSLLFLSPWRGVSRGISIVGICGVVVCGLVLGTIHPIMLLRNIMFSDPNVIGPALTVIGGILVLGLGTTIGAIIASRLCRSTALLWAAFPVLGLAPVLAVISLLRLVNNMLIAELLPPVAGTLPYVALLLVSISVREHNRRVPPDPSSEREV